MKRQKKSRIAKTILKKVNKVKGVTLTNAEAHCITAVIKTALVEGKTRGSMEQNREAEMTHRCMSE